MADQIHRWDREDGDEKQRREAETKDICNTALLKIAVPEEDYNEHPTWLRKTNEQITKHTIFRRWRRFQDKQEIKSKPQFKQQRKLQFEEECYFVAGCRERVLKDEPKWRTISGDQATSLVPVLCSTIESISLETMFDFHQPRIVLRL